MKIDPRPVPPDRSPNALSRRKPPWLKVKSFGGTEFNRVSGLLNDLRLNTVCQEANCPNRGECFTRGTAVFLLMGPSCTRNCSFCNVHSGRPSPIDSEEPRRVAEACRRMNLRHVVITSVTRDDLVDGGAAHFAETVLAVRAALSKATIEVLTPDFRGSTESLRVVMAAKPDVFNHNVETVPRLYQQVRPGADYRRSLELLRSASAFDRVLIKSGLMVGLGETVAELKQVFRDLAESRVSLLTIGQYLAPSSAHFPIARYVLPEEFEEYRDLAQAAGIGSVFSGPLVRSSYLADRFIAER
ncbi:lipoyl synthase [candidate division GN15 bacterium]|uniref:Lipoyl synthase n=1 Tax=candidate division GN15 bacterium TaxID=2072418 RepID=A0A855WXE7_9BACT|nr:MAG: lipoyl synthase [candidate division GN15 bacterium]